MERLVSKLEFETGAEANSLVSCDEARNRNSMGYKSRTQISGNGVEKATIRGTVLFNRSRLPLPFSLVR